MTPILGFISSLRVLSHVLQQLLLEGEDLRFGVLEKPLHSAKMLNQHPPPLPKTTKTQQQPKLVCVCIYMYALHSDSRKAYNSKPEKPKSLGPANPFKPESQKPLNPKP